MYVMIFFFFFPNFIPPEFTYPSRGGLLLYSREIMLTLLNISLLAYRRSCDTQHRDFPVSKYPQSAPKPLLEPRTSSRGFLSVEEDRL